MHFHGYSRTTITIMFTHCTQSLCAYSQCLSTWGQEICQSLKGKQCNLCILYFSEYEKGLHYFTSYLKKIQKSCNLLSITPNSIPLWQLTRFCNGAHFYSPGVAEVILASTALLQPQFGEDSHQDHDGHHTTDDVHNHVSPIPLMVWLHLSVGGHRFSSVGPNWSVIVGAGGLIQSLLTELTAEPVETGAATVQEDTCITIKGRVPLTHDIIVTPAAGASGWHSILLHLCRCGQSWRPL